MNDIKQLSIVVHDSYNMSRPPLVVSLQVLREVGSELVVGFPWGEEASIGKAAVERIFGTASKIKVANQDELIRLHATFSEGFAISGNGLIRVLVAGATQSGAAKKVRVSGVVHRPKKYTDEFLIKTHTVTVPAAHVQVHGGRKYVFRWVLKRAICENVLNGEAWPARIDGGGMVRSRKTVGAHLQAT